MSAAATATADAAAEAPKKGKKKLIIILAAVLLLVLGGGGAAFFVMKKKAAEAAAAAEEAEEDGVPAKKSAKAKEKKKDAHGAPPVFVPLDPFVVNLADREAERYAQIGVTLEIEDAKTGDQIKAYMPAIRNNILMVLAHKTSAQMLERQGKEKLAREIRREALRAMGVEVDDEDEEEAADAHGTDGEKAAPKKKKKKKPVAEEAPIKAVQFSNFIIQ